MIGKLNGAHQVIEFVCQEQPRFLFRGLKVPQWPNGRPLNSKFVHFEGLLACYISKLIPLMGKLIETHFIMSLVCQGPPSPLQRSLALNACQGHLGG